MLSADILLQWQYLIFLLPLAVSALLLLLASVRLGHHSGVHGGHSGHAGAGHGHGPGHVHNAGPAHGAAQGRTVTAQGPGHAGGSRPAPAPPSTHAGKAGTQRTTSEPAQRNVASPAGMLLRLMGVGRAPLPMVLEAFCMAWGLCGFFANEALLHNAPNPGLIRMLPSFVIALGGGLVGARIAAELMARLMPPEESQAVSREGLFGLTGSVTFPVSVTSGRVHIYDEFGTLHDEMCRVPDGRPAIEKGCRVMVMDTDPQGLLIVEEIPR